MFESISIHVLKQIMIRIKTCVVHPPIFSSPKMSTTSPASSESFWCKNGKPLDSWRRERGEICAKGKYIVCRGGENQRRKRWKIFGPGKYVFLWKKWKRRTRWTESSLKFYFLQTLKMSKIECPSSQVGGGNVNPSTSPSSLLVISAWKTLKAYHCQCIQIIRWFPVHNAKQVYLSAFCALSVMIEPMALVWLTTHSTNVRVHLLCKTP